MATFDLNNNNTIAPKDIDLREAATINGKAVVAVGAQVLGGGVGFFKSIAHSTKQHAINNKGGYVDNLLTIDLKGHFRNAERIAYESTEQTKDFFTISTDEDIGTKGKTNGYTNNNNKGA